MRAPLLLSAMVVACAAPGPSTFELEAEWSPIVSSTYGLESDPAFAEVLNPGPARQRAHYTWADVVPLLPPKGAECGDVWTVDVAPLAVFLQQLHPGVRGRLHHYHHEVRLADLPPQVELIPGPEGMQAVAPLREQGVESVEMVAPNAPVGCRATLLTSGDTVDVLLRAHAEFELEAKRVFFTPAQFEARLVVRPDTREVLSFSVAVPNRDTNVDVNAKRADEPGNSFGQADIGHVPRLGLWTKTAAPVLPPEVLDAARARLAQAFYPFARIEWKPLEEAWAAARADNRPLHVLLLFGTLDDESC